MPPPVLLVTALVTSQPLPPFSQGTNTEARLRILLTSLFSCLVFFVTFFGHHHLRPERQDATEYLEQAAGHQVISSSLSIQVVLTKQLQRNEEMKKQSVPAACSEYLGEGRGKYCAKEMGGKKKMRGKKEGQ